MESVKDAAYLSGRAQARRCRTARGVSASCPCVFWVVLVGGVESSSEGKGKKGKHRDPSSGTGICVALQVQGRHAHEDEEKVMPWAPCWAGQVLASILSFSLHPSLFSGQSSFTPPQKNHGEPTDPQSQPESSARRQELDDIISLKRT